MQKSAKRQRPAWAHALFYTIKGLLMFGIGLGLTLTIVGAALANQASLHEQFRHPAVDCGTPLVDAARGTDQ